MKKTKKFLFLVLAAVSVILIFIFRGPVISYDKSRFTDNKESFEIVANTCINFHNKSNKAEEGWIYSIDYNKNNLICYHNQEHYSLNQEEKQAVITVTSVFYLDHHGLDWLFVNNNFVVFGIANGRASFIYSLSGKKPDFVNSPKFNEHNIWVEKITDKWFYACRQS